MVPRLTVGETFSDNVRLNDNDKDGDFITEISPGVSVIGNGRRLRMNLDYEIQNLLFGDNSDASNSHHRLSAGANAELVPDWFFLDAQSIVSQQIIDGQGTFALDNFNVSTNRSDVGSISLNPYLKHDFGGRVKVMVRGIYGKTEFETVASDSENTGVDASIGSGHSAGALRWGLNYYQESINRETANDADYERLSGDLRYRISSTFALLAQAGEEDNNFVTNRSIENGSYWGAGAFWQPSRFISFEALGGSSYKSATVSISPGARTRFSATYRNRDVGINPGSVWSGSVSHRTSHSSWQAAYLEDTTTIQQLILQPVFTENAETGELELLVDFDPVTGQSLVAFGGSLVDEVLERKRATGSVNWNTAKSLFRLSFYSERRERLTTGIGEKLWGANGSWSWRFASRTSARFEVGARQNIIDTSDQDYAFVSARLERRIRPKMSGTVEYRHARQEFSGTGRDYSENRVMARLAMRF